VSPDLSEDVAHAVQRTLEARTARVVVSWWMESEGDAASDLPPERPRAEGVVDFETDRCALELPTVVSGGRQALGRDVDFGQLEDGRWVRWQAKDDQWPVFHPRWLLEALRSGSRSVAPRAGEREAVDLVFDPGRIAALAGFAIGPGEWCEFTGTARWDSEDRISWVEVVAFAPRTETPSGAVVATHSRMRSPAGSTPSVCPWTLSFRLAVG
jgi:hypothetical protein